MQSAESIPIKTKDDKEYHRRKATEYYHQCKETGKYKLYLQNKNQKYKDDPLFREELKKKNNLRYHQNKMKRQELIHTVQA